MAHRDYTSNASVQVMLFADCLEVWNPGELPPSLTPERTGQFMTTLWRDWLTDSAMDQIGLSEVDFPIAVVSRHAAREKSIRHGHPSTLHL